VGTLYTEQTTDPEQFAAALQGPPLERARAILAAARTGLPRAQCLLGQILLTGDGIEQDQALALTWFRIAAQQGDAMALNMLGRCHEHGWGLVKNERRAARYFQQAAELGLDWGQYNLANLLATGRGVERNDARAFALYLQAAEQGHAKSMNLVGRFYEDGLSVAANPATALQWYRRSAEAGDFRGQYSLATVLLALGEEPQACVWLERALHGGNLNFLRATRAALLQAGQPQIQAFALAFHRRAAELGDASDAEAYARITADPKA
jgi:TPR repeat protein